MATRINSQHFDYRYARSCGWSPRQAFRLVKALAFGMRGMDAVRYAEATS